MLLIIKRIIEWIAKAIKSEPVKSKVPLIEIIRDNNGCARGFRKKKSVKRRSK